MVKRALTAPDPAEIEPQGRKAAMHESIVKLVNDRMVHRPAELRVGVQNDGDRRVLLPRRMISSIDAAGGTGEDNLRHCYRPRPGLLSWLAVSCCFCSCGTDPTAIQFRIILIIWIPLFLASTHAIRAKRFRASNTISGAKSKLFAGSRGRKTVIE